MKEIIPNCNLVIFLGTEKSVKESPECLYELEVATKFNLPIIPIKGTDILWKDMKNIVLSRELGLEYEPNNFDDFFNKLLQYIRKIKQKIDLIDPKAQYTERVYLKTKNRIKQYINSKEFKDELVNNLEKIDALNEELDLGSIDSTEFLKKLILIINKEILEKEI